METTHDTTTDTTEHSETPVDKTAPGARQASAIRQRLSEIHSEITGLIQERDKLNTELLHAELS